MFNLRTISVVYALLATSLFSQQVETLTEEFNGSGGIAVDKSGVLYVSNFGSGFGASDGKELFKVYKDGTVEEFATGLSGGSGNAIDVEGNIYQSNINNNTVSKITPDGEVTLFANSNLSSPVGVAVDSKGNVFVANCGSNSIAKITPDGSTEIFASSLRDFKCPNGLTIDENDNLYTCNYSNGKVFKINLDGSVSLLANLPGGNNSHLAYANNSLYVAKRCDNKIYRVQLDGTFELIAGTGERGNDDGDPLSATINLPNGLSVSPSGDTLYFSSKTSFNGDCLGTDLNPVVIRMITGLNSTTDVNQDEELTTELRLEQNYPNPFNPSTTIRFNLPKTINGAEKTSLKVYDLIGREIVVLIDGTKSAGSYEVDFEAVNLTSGIYFYVLRYGSMKLTKKLTVLK